MFAAGTAHSVVKIPSVHMYLCGCVFGHMHACVQISAWPHMGVHVGMDMCLSIYQYVCTETQWIPLDVANSVYRHTSYEFT